MVTNRTKTSDRLVSSVREHIILSFALKSYQRERHTSGPSLLPVSRQGIAILHQLRMPQDQKPLEKQQTSLGYSFIGIFIVFGRIFCVIFGYVRLSSYRSTFLRLLKFKNSLSRKVNLKIRGTVILF
jgi:hypothetical protein